MGKTATVTLQQETSLQPELRKKKLSFKEKVAFGTGGVAETIATNIVFTLALPIYSIALGVDAVLVGIAVSIPRLWDAFSDPVMGNISDNTRFRLGRRKPYIFIGALLTGLLCIAMWAPPVSLSKNALFIYFLVISILYFTTSTVFQVPYAALGFELADDYDERIKVMSYKFFIMNIGTLLFLPWVYRFCFMFGENEVEGARIVGLMAGVLIILFGITPVFFCKEKIGALNQDKISFFKAFGQTAKNRSFLILCGILFFVIVGFFVANPLLVYINLAYICPGDKERAAIMFGYSGFVYGLFSFASVPLISYLAKKWGKKLVLFAGIVFVMFGFGLSWFYFSDKYPYLQLLFGIVASPGMACVWVLTASSIANICDIDELETGLRREGMYGAIISWLVKFGLSLILLFSGFIIKWTGFDQEVAIQSKSTITRLRLMFALTPIVFLGCGAILTCIYPITKKRVEQVQSLLRAKAETD